MKTEAGLRGLNDSKRRRVQVAISAYVEPQLRRDAEVPGDQHRSPAHVNGPRLFSGLKF